MERERKAREEESSSKTHEGLWQQQESVKSAKQTVQGKEEVEKDIYKQRERESEEILLWRAVKE